MFTGLHDLFFPDAHGLFDSLGAHSLRMLAAAVELFIITRRAGFRRHYRRTLESEDTRPRIGSNRRSNRLVRSPEERAIFQFSGKTLARSRKHQVFLVTTSALESLSPSISQRQSTPARSFSRKMERARSLF